MLQPKKQGVLSKGKEKYQKLPRRSEPDSVKAPGTGDSETLSFVLLNEQNSCNRNNRLFMHLPP